MRCSFSQLLKSVNTSVDSLYSHIESTNNIDSARDAAKILTSCAEDFTALEKRIRVQGEYVFLNADAVSKRKKDKKQHAGEHAPHANNRKQPAMASVSWDIRKTSTDKSNVMVRSSIARMEREAKQQREMNRFAEDDADSQDSGQDGTELPSPAARLPSENAWSRRIAFNEDGSEAEEEKKEPTSPPLHITGKKIKILPPPKPVFVTQEQAGQFPPATNRMTMSEFGERIYTLLYASQGDLAGKITGMLLELDNDELVNLLNDCSALNVKVAEALRVLQEYEAQQSHLLSDDDNFVDIVDNNEGTETETDNDAERK